MRTYPQSFKCESDDFDYPPWVVGSIPTSDESRDRIAIAQSGRATGQAKANEIAIYSHLIFTAEPLGWIIGSIPIRRKVNGRPERDNSKPNFVLPKFCRVGRLLFSIIQTDRP